MSFYVKTGAINELTPELFGISHFLEHMVFNGSNKYPSREGTDKAVVGMGVYQNAWTWFAQTNYYMNSSIGSLPEAFDILLNRVFDPILREEDVEKEKGIIQEERVMGENSPERELYYKINNQLYKGTPAGHQILGTKQSIAGFNSELLRKFHNTYYSPRNVSLITYGGLSQEEISKIVHEPIEKIENKEEVDFGKSLDLKISGEVKHEDLVLDKVTSATFLQDFSIFEKPQTLEEYVNWVYIRAILEEGRVSILEKKLVLENSLVSTYDLDVFINGLYLNFLFGATTQRKNLEEVKGKYEEVFSNIPEYITEETMKRARGYLKGALLMSIEDPFLVTDSDFLNVEYLNQILDIEVGFEQLEEEIFSKKLLDVRRFAEELDPLVRSSGVIL